MSTINFHIWPGSIHIWRCWDMTIDSASEVLHDYTKFFDNPILFALFWFSESGLGLIFSRRREVWEVGRHSLSLSGPGPGDPWRQWQRIVSQFYCLLSRLLSKQLWSARTSQCTTLSLTLGFKLERETWGFKVQWFGHIILPSNTSPSRQYPESCILVLPPGCTRCPGKTCTLRRFYFKYLYVSGSLIKFIFKSLNLT